MNAIVSGRAGVALILDGESSASLRVETSDRATPFRPEDFHLLLGDAGDLQILEGVDIAHVIQALTLESARALAVELVLILLDEQFSLATRRSAAEELECLLKQGPVAGYVENVFCARVLPDRTVRFCSQDRMLDSFERVRHFVQGVCKLQPQIAKVHRAWVIIPLHFFDPDGMRARLQATFVRWGVFRELARAIYQGPVIWGDMIARCERLMSDAHEGGEIRHIISEWLAILDSGAGQGRENSLADTGAASEDLIGKLYERVRIDRSRAGANVAGDVVFSELRRVQIHEARKMGHCWALKASVSIRRWSEALAAAEKALGV